MLNFIIGASIFAIGAYGVYWLKKEIVDLSDWSI